MRASCLENNLSFNHDGNRMTSLSDAHATGTDAGAKSFTYDANGNLVNDGRKGLDLRWNLLNLVDSAGMHGSSLRYRDPYGLWIEDQANGFLFAEIGDKAISLAQ